MFSVSHKLGLKKLNRKARKAIGFLDKAKDYSNEYAHYWNNVWGF